ncbi:diacylglycerol/polyprenol kinase family protein [Chloroflexota bacterium]
MTGSGRLMISTELGQDGPAGRAGRRLWHLCGGLVFPILAFFLSRITLLFSVSGVAAAFLAFDLARFLSPRLNRWVFRRLDGLARESEWSQPTGSSYLLVASVLTFLLFDQALASAALIFLAVGDPAAATVGERVGRGRLLDKSLFGGVAFFVVCLVCAMVMLSAGVELSGWVLLVGVLSAATIRLFSLPLSDNVAIPVFSAGMMRLLMDYLH